MPASKPIEISYKLTGAGWSQARVQIGEAWTMLTASYLGDALADLLAAVNAIAQGASTARASWDEEPGEYRWIFDGEGDTVRLRVLWFDELPDVPRPPSSTRSRGVRNRSNGLSGCSAPLSRSKR